MVPSSHNSSHLD